MLVCEDSDSLINCLFPLSSVPTKHTSSRSTYTGTIEIGDTKSGVGRFVVGGSFAGLVGLRSISLDGELVFLSNGAEDGLTCNVGSLLLSGVRTGAFESR